MRLIEYIKRSKIVESSERMYKTKDESLKVRVVDDNISKGSIYVNDKKIVTFTFSGAGIETVNIDSSEELVGCFLELIKDLVGLDNNEDVGSDVGGINSEEEEENENKGVKSEEVEGEEEGNKLTMKDLEKLADVFKK